MSWQSYIEKLTGDVDCKLAIIAGLDGQVWAGNPLALETVTQDELKTIAGAIKSNGQSFQEKGVHFGTEKYFCLAADEDNGILRARKGQSPMTIVATNQALICVVAHEKFSPGDLNIVVERLADWLKQCGY